MVRARGAVLLASLAVLAAGCGDLTPLPRPTPPSPPGWDGSRTELQPHEAVELSPAPDGTIAVVALNLDTRNSTAELAISAGGLPPEVIDLPPLSNAPVVRLRDYGGSSVRLTNASDESAVSVAVYGPGFGRSGALPDDGQLRALAPLESVQTFAEPQYQTVRLNNSLNQLSVFLIYFGGAAGLYAVNASGSTPPYQCSNQDAGADADAGPGDGYTLATSSNLLLIQCNWTGKVIYLANVSPLNATGGMVGLSDP